MKKRVQSRYIPLFDRQIRSIPFRCRAMRANSQNDSLILKSHNGDISKQAILFLDAYSSACLAATCLLNAKCKRLPTNTFGTPGACCSFRNIKSKNSREQKPNGCLVFIRICFVMKSNEMSQIVGTHFKKGKPTSSTSLSHRSMPSKLHLFVMSYTSITPWAPREYDRIIVQKRPCPDVSYGAKQKIR